ncbi:hypothetical protein HQN84_18450 [Pedobacter steynii]|nr:hypothetical protein [Pedobacter steynii]NQX40836.1 hypothetical protein [Pedobacter steynii]
MKKLSLKPNAFNKEEVLTKKQLKKVLGGDGSSAPGSTFCRFKYKYSETDDWTNWSEFINAPDGGNDTCVKWIAAGQVRHCGYECI